MIHLPPHVLSPPPIITYRPSIIAPCSICIATDITNHTYIHNTTTRTTISNIDITGNDQREARRAAEAVIRQARQALNAGYSIYRRTLNEEQTQVVNRAIDSNDIDEYLDVVDTFRDRRILPTTWTNDHPYTRYL